MKNKGVIISIGLILIIGVLVTGGTRRFVTDGKSTAKAADEAAHSGLLYSDARTGAENIPGLETAKASASSKLSSGMAGEQRDTVIPQEVVAAEAEAGGAEPEMAAESGGQTASDEVSAAAGNDTGEALSSEEFAAAEAADRAALLGAAPAPAAVISEDTEDPAGDTAKTDAPAAEDGKAARKSSEESASSVVISPLTGMVEYKETAGTLLTEEDYQKRFQEVDSRIQKVKESGVVPNTDTFKNMAEYEYRLWDNELNTIYRDILKGLTEEETEELKKEEREWMKTRDETARKAASKYSGGSIESMEYTASLADSTRSRAYGLLETYGDRLPAQVSTEGAGAH